ncbi:SDR family oxidoreductase [Jatrophihabitans sp.]|uniref:SDR family oxidoreductase n=1 Tax=Jatrophihabitans sp. TaxID=1932789 RepID=UPI002C572C89|nr:NAD(P)H-binding protein [Jatrophihabitans sp.]
MRIAAAGGTGLIGRHVVSLVEQAGHEPVVLARSRGVNLTTGAGLDAALAGVEVVIDVSNVTTLSRKRSVQFFTAATSQLLAAGARAGVRHHVALSIVGVDRVGWGYYAGKLRQEDLISAGRVPWTVLRATQFHEFAEQLLARSPGPLVPVPRMRVQPVAAREVAARLVELALGPAAGRAPEIAGPQVHELVELVRQLVRARNQRRVVLGIRIPGGAAAAGGGLLPAGDYTRGSETFSEWLRSTGPSGAASAG